MPKDEKKMGYYPVLGMTFILAACSLLYELLLAQTITSLASHTVLWYSVTVGLYIGALGWGAFQAERFIHRHRESQLLFRVEVGLSALGALALVVIYFMHLIASVLWIRGQAIGWHVVPFFIVALFFIISIGVLSGWEFPLLLRLAQKVREEKHVVNKVLATDYFGSLAAGFIFPVVLLPRLELLSIGFSTALINLAVAGFIYYRYERTEKGSIFQKAMWGLAVLLLICFVGLPVLQQYFLKKFYYYEEQMDSFGDLIMPIRGYPDIERVSSAYQKIDLVKSPPLLFPFGQLMETYSQKYKMEPNFPRDYVLYIDGIFQFWSNFEELYHEYFAHIPMILNSDVPESVLVLGAGDGLLLRELIKYPQVKKITLVDIDAKMVDWAVNHPVIVQANHKAFDDPRVQVIIADAYQFVRKTEEKYDAIYMDFPAPEDYHLSKLYSREFYTFVRKALKPNGFVVFDAPFLPIKNEAQAIGKNPLDRDWLIYYHTMQAAGFETVYPYFSRLEWDNEQALKIIKDQIGNAKRLIVHEADMSGAARKKEVVGKEAIAKHMLGDFINDYTHRFIIAWPRAKQINKTYINYSIPTYILNKKRFDVMISAALDYQEPLKQTYVNSVMKPIIPDLSHWHRLKIIY